MAVSSRTLNNMRNEIDVLKQIQNELALDQYQMASLLDISESSLKDTYNQKRNLKFNNLFSLSKKLNIDMDCLLNDDVDFDLVRSFYYQDQSRLSEKYLDKAPFSKMKSTKSLFDYISYTHSGHNLLKENFLRHFQINEDILENKNLSVNLNFIKDTTKFLNQFIELDYYSAGQFSCYNLATKPFIKSLKKLNYSKTPRKLFEYFFENLIKHFEENFDYKITKASNQDIYFSVSPKESVQDSYRKNIIDNKAISYYRCGVISALPTLIDHSALDVVSINNVNKKNPVYKYRIYLN